MRWSEAKMAHRRISPATAFHGFFDGSFDNMAPECLANAEREPNTLTNLEGGLLTRFRPRLFND